MGNPLDLGDIFDFSFYVRVVEKVLRQPDIDGVVFIHVSHMMVEREATRGLVENLYGTVLQSGKPVATVMDIPFEERVFLEENSNSPFFPGTYGSCAGPCGCSWSGAKPNACRPSEARIRHGCSRLSRRHSWPYLSNISRSGSVTSKTKSAAPSSRGARFAGPGRHTGRALAHGKSLDEALEASGDLGFPVALKAVSPSLLHKSDKGGMALNVRDAESLRNEWHRLQKVSDDISGIVVQKMAPASRELVVGGKKDPSFGPVVLTGLGGIMVEVMKDVSMRLAPIDIDAAMEMLGELSGKRILGRFRGMPEADLKAAARILVQVSLLMHRFPQIREMDLNPVALTMKGRGLWLWTRGC